MKKIEKQITELNNKITYEIEPNFIELEQSLNYSVSKEDWNRLSIVLSTLDTLGIIKDFRKYYMDIKHGNLELKDFIESIKVKKMKRTRFEIEQEVRGLANEIAQEYDAESDFYGDCYPDEIFELENKLELAKSDEEYDKILEDVVQAFRNCIEV